MTPTRRAVLAGGALLAVSACTGSSGAGRPARPDPDVPLRADAVARERALLASYDALLAAQPDLAPRLGPLREEHAAHLAALGAEQAPATVPPSGAAPSPAAAPGVAALVRAERDAAAAHAAATAAASPALAAVLAQLAASEASHPVALA